MISVAEMFHGLLRDSAEDLERNHFKYLSLRCSISN